MIRRERLTAALEGEFAVFLIGIRINSISKIHKWLPAIRAMPRMINELTLHPELGLLHTELWVARTTIMVQYWRSIDQLFAYASSKTSEHLPAWRRFNRSVGTDGSVGIWHEAYSVSPGSQKSMYVNMPPFGLGMAGKLLSAVGQDRSELSRREEPLGV